MNGEPPPGARLEHMVPAVAGSTASAGRVARTEGLERRNSRGQAAKVQSEEAASMTQLPPVARVFPQSEPDPNGALPRTGNGAWTAHATPCACERQLGGTSPEKAQSSGRCGAVQ